MTAENTKTSSLYEEYETDRSAEENGQWVDMKGGVKIKIRAEDSHFVRKWIAKQAKKRRVELMAAGGTLTPEQSDRYDIEACANVLISDWAGVTNRAGELLPFSKANITQVLTDLPALRRDIIYASRVDETFKQDTKEAIEGNS